MELQHILEDFVAMGRPIGTHYDDEKTFSIYINPTFEEMKEAVESSRSNDFLPPPYDKALRAFTYKDDIYVWGAMNQVHFSTYGILKKNGIDVEEYRAIPLWLYLDKNYRVFEVRVSPSISHTEYEKYSFYLDRKVSPEIFQFIKPNSNLKLLCTPRTKWSVKMGD